MLKPCWRVPVTRGDRAIAPIIAADTEAEATERAGVLGDAVLPRRPLLPWVEPDWPRRQNQTGAIPPLEIGRPVLIHRIGLHP